MKPVFRPIVDLPSVAEPETWEFSAHFGAGSVGSTLRLGNPKTGQIHAFRIPDGKWPEPKKAVRLVPIPGWKGRAVGREMRTQADVYHSTPEPGRGTKLRFSVGDGEGTQHYSIRQDAGGWWLNKKMSADKENTMSTQEKQAMMGAFFDELEKIGGMVNSLKGVPGAAGRLMNHHLAVPALEAAGLGILAVPSARTLMSHDSDPKERSHAKWEMAGLGVLGAHPAYEIGKHLLHR